MAPLRPLPGRVFPHGCARATLLRHAFRPAATVAGAATPRMEQVMDMRRQVRVVGLWLVVAAGACTTTGTNDDAGNVTPADAAVAQDAGVVGDAGSRDAAVGRDAAVTMDASVRPDASTPDAANTPGSLAVLAGLYAGLPILLKLASILLIWRFEIDAASQRRLRQQIEIAEGTV